MISKELSFDYLVDKYSKRFRLPRDIMEDFVQESYYKFYKTAPKETNLGGWFYITIRNQVIDYKRKNNQLYDYQRTLNLQDINPCEFSKQEVQDMIDKLEPHFKKVIIDYYFLGFKIKELSEIYGMSENTIKSRMRWAKINLKRIINDFYS